MVFLCSRLRAVWCAPANAIRKSRIFWISTAARSARVPGVIFGRWNFRQVTEPNRPPQPSHRSHIHCNVSPYSIIINIIALRAESYQSIPNF